MNIRGDITFIYESKNDAEVAYDSMEADNEDYLESKLNGNEIEYTIESKKLGTFLATADDLIAAEIVVENIVKKIKQ